MPVHDTQLRADVAARVRARRGKAWVHDTIDASRAALLVVDMQHAFVEPGRPSAVPAALAIVPNINRLAAAFRDAAGAVAWVYTTFSADALNDWSAFFGGVYSVDFSRSVIEHLSAGAPGHALWRGLDVRPQDQRLSKDRFSAFLPGHCELEARLRERGIDTVVITGTLTNVCCESTARDAVMRNFSVVMVADGNAALSDADHNASMNALAQTFGDVMTTAQVLERLTPAARRRGARA